ncbi:hypothetical protein SSS_01601 [Sarcoptes scabiei]|nr:hypothetical protein SSS_01601 [Sarcoptes scabiei]KPM10399.1 splicing factor, proline- and glutamine-rich-like protein [Sarcoptes scabiei]
MDSGGGQANGRETPNHSPNKQQHMKKRKMNTSNQQDGSNNQQHQAQNSTGSSNWSQPNGQSGQHAGHRLNGSPAWDLQPQNTEPQQFTGRCRLFVANLPANVTEESLRKLFSEFGQISDIFIGKSNQFAFIKMDTRSNAENAKNTLDGKPFEGRTLRVRLAAHAAAIKVSNLPPCASNELLHLAFSTFGPIERAIVVADDRGRSLNEGIIEFARKSSAQAAIKKCQNECLLLSSTSIPVIATSLESRDEEEGVPERSVIHNAEYRKEREIGPRFSEPNSVEHEIAKKWKEFNQHEVDKRQAFEAEMQALRDNFQIEMEYLRLEETTKQLREQLMQMECQIQQLDTQRDARYNFERQRTDQRRQHENTLRQQEEQLVGQHTQNDVNALRRQESDLRQKANALQQILDRQEQSLRKMDPSIGQHMDANLYGQHMMPPPPPPGANAMVMPVASPYQQQVNYPQHPQMNHYGHHQIPPSPPQIVRPMVPYNGVPPPNMVSPSQNPYGQQPQPLNNNMGGAGGSPVVQGVVQDYRQQGNHTGNGIGNGNYNKRTRRF